MGEGRVDAGPARDGRSRHGGCVVGTAHGFRPARGRPAPCVSRAWQGQGRHRRSGADRPFRRPALSVDGAGERPACPPAAGLMGARICASPPRCRSFQRRAPGRSGGRAAPRAIPEGRTGVREYHYLSGVCGVRSPVMGAGGVPARQWRGAQGRSHPRQGKPVPGSHGGVESLCIRDMLNMIEVPMTAGSISSRPDVSPDFLGGNAVMWRARRVIPALSAGPVRCAGRGDPAAGAAVHRAAAAKDRLSGRHATDGLGRAPCLKVRHARHTGPMLPTRRRVRARGGRLRDDDGRSHLTPNFDRFDP